MIGKIKITQEQADEIKDIQDIAYAIDIHSFNKHPDKAIAGLSTADLARALLIGYEVELEYKVGDWVAHESRKERRHICGKIDLTAFDDVIFNYLDEDGEWERIRIHKSAAELMTPEEIKAEKRRRVWAEIGRKSNALKPGDVLLTDDGEKLVSKHTGQVLYKGSYRSCADLLHDGKVKGFYPAESFVSFEEGDSE